MSNDLPPLLPQTGEARLRELAVSGAAQEHNYHTEGIQTLDSGGHRGWFVNCPHPDCLLVRSAWGAKEHHEETILPGNQNPAGMRPSGDSADFMVAIESGAGLGDCGTRGQERDSVPSVQCGRPTERGSRNLPTLAGSAQAPEPPPLREGRDRLRTLRRDIGTVRTVIQRKHELTQEERAQCQMLTKWEDDIDHIDACLAASSSDEQAEKRP